jgi:hypothetical protein
MPANIAHGKLRASRSRLFRPLGFSGNSALRCIKQDCTRPVSFVSAIRFHGLFDDGMFRLSERNVQLVRPAIFRVFRWSSHAEILAKKTCACQLSSCNCVLILAKLIPALDNGFVQESC